MSKVILRAVKIFGDIQKGTEEALAVGAKFVGYSQDSGRFFELNEAVEAGYDTYSVEEMAGRLETSVELLKEIVKNGEDHYLDLGPAPVIEEPVVEAPVTNLSITDSGAVGIDYGQGESLSITVTPDQIADKVDFKELYMAAMEENRALSAENAELFKETVELTQKNVNLESELDLLKTDDGKLAELVKSKGYMLIVK